jgi:hypothetical protein
MAGKKGKTGIHTNRSNQWLKGTTERSRTDEVFAFKPQLSVIQAIKADIEERQITKTQWLDMAVECQLGIKSDGVETGLNHPLIQEALSDSLEKKRIAIARERKQKRPNQKLIEVWEKEIKELESFLEGDVPEL